MSYLFIWLNGTHKLLIYVDDINKLGGSLYTIMKKKDPRSGQGKFTCRSSVEVSRVSSDCREQSCSQLADTETVARFPANEGM
jgi:hypothetical protein